MRSLAHYNNKYLFIIYSAVPDQCENVNDLNDLNDHNDLSAPSLQH
jgi:hypothetical protein